MKEIILNTNEELSDEFAECYDASFFAEDFSQSSPLLDFSRGGMFGVIPDVGKEELGVINSNHKLHIISSGKPNIK
jgi:hypothetical protein